jgi:hypothetical protein
VLLVTKRDILNLLKVSGHPLKPHEHYRFLEKQMILSISHERAAQIKTVARFAGLASLVAIALVALFCYLVSALGLRYGRLARSRFECWGGFARLYEVLDLNNVREGVGFWGAAQWAAEYSLTAAAIALVAVVHATVLLYEAIAAQLARKEVLQLSAAVELLAPAAKVSSPVEPLALAAAKPMLAIAPAPATPAQRGRKPALTAEQRQELRQQRDNGATFEQLCAQFGISRSTVKRSLRAA